MTRAEDIQQRESGLSPAKRTLLEKWKRGGKATQSIPRRAAHGATPLSFAQLRLWVLDQLVPGSAAYNIPGALRLSGALNLAALERSLSAIVARHESLRTTFATIDGQPAQVIAAPAPLALPVADLRWLPEAE